MDAEAFVVVAADSDQARSAMKAYFAELDERFVDGFDVDGAFDDDAGIFDPPAGSFVIVLDGERVVGCGGVQRHDDHTGEIKRMWVDASMRGRGLGRRLLTRLEGETRTLGYSSVVLDTNAVLAQAISMYESAGYVAIERYNDNPYAHHWFRKAL